MIPNTIHSCWFSNDQLPAKLSLCRQSWEAREAGMNIKIWNADMFAEIPDKPDWVLEAYQQGKWAFVSDYVRQYAVYTEGGWYLDSDVFLLQSNFMERFSDCSFISCPEDACVFYDGPTEEIEGFTFGIGIQAACFGGEIGNDLCGETLNIYHNIGDYLRILESRDDKYYPIAPQIMEKAGVTIGAVRRNELGTYVKEVKGKTYMFLKDLCVNGGMRNVDQATGTPYAIHLCSGSWRKLSPKW